MRRVTMWVALIWCLSIAPVLVFAGTRKAGLWEITNATTWQKTTGAPGTFVDPATGGPHTKQVCLTQEMIDKYGALLPQSRGQCHIEDKVIRTGGASARWVCTGNMKGTGSLEINWANPEHADGTLHFEGTIQVGAEARPVEWTTVSTSVFKRSDCGDVKPMPLQGSER